MGVIEAKEKRPESDRYVDTNIGLWTGRYPLPWYYRIPLAPIYGIWMAWWCLKGVPVNLQVLHDEDHEPKSQSNKIVQCPQCGQMESSVYEDIGLGVEIEVTVRK